LRKVLEPETLGLDFVCNLFCQWVEGWFRVSLFLFNCTEVEVINRQLAGVLDVFLNVGFGGGFGVEGA
jgi:hypothetical protein